jgi:hypothetical protein
LILVNASGRLSQIMKTTAEGLRGLVRDGASARARACRFARRRLAGPLPFSDRQNRPLEPSDARQGDRRNPGGRQAEPPRLLRPPLSRGPQSLVLQNDALDTHLEHAKLVAYARFAGVPCRVPGGGREGGRGYLRTRTFARFRNGESQRSRWSKGFAASGPEGFELLNGGTNSLDIASA